MPSDAAGLIIQARDDARADGVCEVAVSGEVDLATADELLEQVQPVIARCDRVALDLSGVSFIDSSGLAALMKLRNVATGRGAEFSLMNLTATTQRLLQITGLLDAFDIASPAGPEADDDQPGRR